MIASIVPVPGVVWYNQSVFLPIMMASYGAVSLPRVVYLYDERIVVGVDRWTLLFLLHKRTYLVPLVSCFILLVTDTVS